MHKKENFSENEGVSEVRLDKWLWAARFYKTRSIAKMMIEGGKVHYNQQRVKPNKIVKTGARIRLVQSNTEKEIIVLGIIDKRVAAPEAQKLYQETQESIRQREQVADARRYGVLTMPNPKRRPTKKERRELIKFRLNQ